MDSFTTTTATTSTTLHQHEPNHHDKDRTPTHRHRHDRTSIIKHGKRHYHHSIIQSNMILNNNNDPTVSKLEPEQDAATAVAVAAAFAEAADLVKQYNDMIQKMQRMDTFTVNDPRYIDLKENLREARAYYLQLSQSTSQKELKGTSKATGLLPKLTNYDELNHFLLEKIKFFR